MNSVKSLKKIYDIVNILTLVTMGLLLLCFCFSFDSQNGYLIQSPLTLVFTVAYIAGIVVSVASIFVHSEFDILKSPDEINGMAKVYYATNSAACILIGMLGFFLTNDVNDVHTTLVAGVGAILFGIFIALLLTRGGYSFKVVKLLFLFLSISLPIILALGNTRNYIHHINSIENILCVLFSISFLLYILNEAKRLCKGIHPTWHFASMLMTYVTGFSLSGAYLIAFILDTVNEGYRFYQMLIIFAVSAFMSIEMKHFLYTLTPESKINWLKKQAEAKNENAQ